MRGGVVVELPQCHTGFTLSFPPRNDDRMHNRGQYNKLDKLRLGIMHKLLLSLCAVIVTTLAAGQQPANPQPSGISGQPSLADIARQQRSRTKSPAIINVDGETVRNTSGRLSTSGDDATASADDTKKDADKKTDEKDAENKTADAKPADSKDASQKPADKPKGEDFAAKIDAQKKDIALLQREIDVAQREQRLRAAAFYADAGTQLRDPGKFAEENRAQQEQIDTKKQALDAAQQKLDDLQEQARKSGVKSE